jgi:hypothetical protein
MCGRVSVLLVSTAVALRLGLPVQAARAASTRRRLKLSSVAHPPALARNCWPCHGSEKQRKHPPRLATRTVERG